MERPPPHPFQVDNIVNGKIVWGTLEFIPKSIATTLWEGSVGNATSRIDGVSISLSESLSSYDAFIITLISYTDASHTDTTLRRRYCRFHDVKDYLSFIQSGTPSTDHISFCWGFGSNQEFMDILPTSTVQSFVMNLNYTVLTKVEAVKYPQSRK